MTDSEKTQIFSIVLGSCANFGYALNVPHYSDGIPRPKAVGLLLTDSRGLSGRLTFSIGTFYYDATVGYPVK